MVFVAGQKLRASDLNELGGGTTGGSNPTGGTAIMTTNVTVTNSTSFSNATGLTFDLAANATYAFEAWLLYTAISTADLKVRPGPPSGGTGYWSLIGAVHDQTPVASTEWVNYGAWQVSDLGTSRNVAGDTAGTALMVALMHGFVTTTTAGAQQVLVSQRAAQATGTIVRAGSWLRVTRVS